MAPMEKKTTGPITKMATHTTQAKVLVEKKNPTISGLVRVSKVTKPFRPPAPQKLLLDCELRERSTPNADDWYRQLVQEVEPLYWSRDTPELQFVTEAGAVPLPRDKFFVGDRWWGEDPETKEKVILCPLYRYSEETLTVCKWTPILRTIRDWIQNETGQYCNHVVGNRYVNGRDCIGPHVDKSRDFVPGSSVYTLSFGATRVLRFRRGTTAVLDVPLTHGSLFKLGWHTNEAYKHEIVKTDKPCEVRLSLTFRAIQTVGREEGHLLRFFAPDGAQHGGRNGTKKPTEGTERAGAAKRGATAPAMGSDARPIKKPKDHHADSEQKGRNIEHSEQQSRKAGVNQSAEPSSIEQKGRKIEAKPSSIEQKGRKIEAKQSSIEDPPSLSSSSSSAELSPSLSWENLETGLVGRWNQELKGEWEKPYWDTLKMSLLCEAESGQVIYPPIDKVFAAFTHCSYEAVRVVLIGQDPYHGPGQAEGMCFSVGRGTTPPPSLENIWIELMRDVPGHARPSHGSLLHWAQQGVLLLNAILTVTKGRPESHADFGWETFTDTVLSVLNTKKRDLVFVLWGNKAKKKAEKIDRSRHHVLTAAHPSPRSAEHGFFGCRHFSQINQWLIRHKQKPIDWFSSSSS